MDLSFKNTSSTSVLDQPDLHRNTRPRSDLDLDFDGHPVRVNGTRVREKFGPKKINEVGTWNISSFFALSSYLSYKFISHDFFQINNNISNQNFVQLGFNIMMNSNISHTRHNLFFLSFL